MRRLDAVPGEGALLRGLAVLHAFVGIVLYRRELGSISRDGVVAGVPYRGPKPTVFWFLVASPLVWVIGRLVGDAEAVGDWAAVRRAHQISLASAAVAIVLMPISGFWGWLMISARGLWRARIKDSAPAPVLERFSADRVRAYRDSSRLSTPPSEPGTGEKTTWAARLRK